MLEKHTRMRIMYEIAMMSSIRALRLIKG